MPEYISVDDALNHILTRIPDTATERVQLGKCRGRRLAEDIEAPWNSPRFDNSAMDGFALRFDDLEEGPTRLEIAGSSAAGRPSDETLVAGQAFRISTGAALPSGADTVVRRELCDADDDTVTVQEKPSRGKGANIRRTGTYLKAGEPALQAGIRLSGSEIGLLASFGKPIASVYARPRVAIISTGDELIELGETPGPGQIVNSNAYMLEALVESQGAEARVYPTAGDDRDEIEATYKRAIADCDLVLSSGGVSVGTHDHVGTVVDDLSTDGMTFWKVRMKPGKPLAFGLADTGGRSVPMIGLPGNPASSFVGFQLFVRPALAVAQGAALSPAPLARVDAVLEGTAHGSRGRRAYLAGRAVSTGDGLAFTPREHQSSGNPALFANVNALGIVDQGRKKIATGKRIPVHLL